MRAFVLIVFFYAAHALAPPFPPPADKSVTEAATFLTVKMPEVPLRQRLKRNISSNKKRRIRRVVHRKPPVVWVYPDKVEVFGYAEFWAIERAKVKGLAAWCVGVAIR